MVYKLNIDIIKPRTPKISLYRSNHPLSDINPEAFYRTSIYISILDYVLNDLQNRFSEDDLNSFNLRLLMPATIDFETLQNSKEANKTKQRVIKLLEIYSGALDNNAVYLEAEYDVWLAKWQRMNRNYGRTKIPEKSSRCA